MMPNGEGLTKVKGFSIFVPNVKVGDNVRVKVTTIDSVSADAEVINQAQSSKRTAKVLNFSNIVDAKAYAKV